MPVSIHINYHPEKEQRSTPRHASTLPDQQPRADTWAGHSRVRGASFTVRSVVDYYFEHKRAALDGWNGGEGQNTSTCTPTCG